MPKHKPINAVLRQGFWKGLTAVKYFNTKSAWDDVLRIEPPWSTNPVYVPGDRGLGITTGVVNLSTGVKDWGFDVPNGGTVVLHFYRDPADRWGSSYIGGFRSRNTGYYQPSVMIWPNGNWNLGVGIRGTITYAGAGSLQYNYWYTCVLKWDSQYYSAWLDGSQFATNVDWASTLIWALGTEADGFQCNATHGVGFFYHTRDIWPDSVAQAVSQDFTLMLRSRYEAEWDEGSFYAAAAESGIDDEHITRMYNWMIRERERVV